MHTTFASRVAAGVLLILAGMISIACNTEVGPPLPLAPVQVNNGQDSVTTSGQAPEAIDAATAEPDARQAGLTQLKVQHPTSQIQTAPGLSAPATSVPEQAKPAVVYEALYFTANMLEESSAEASDELSKLVAHSSIIVVGTVSNAQADVVRSPHEGVNNNNVGVANVYGFEVQRYLKGSGLDTISVIQFIGVDVTTAQGETIQARDKLDNLLPGRGSRYLLFLREQDDSNDYWIGTAEPYKFLLSDGLAKVESPVEGMEELFQDQAEFVFVNNVEGKIASSP